MMSPQWKSERNSVCESWKSAHFLLVKFEMFGIKHSFIIIFSFVCVCALAYTCLCACVCVCVRVCVCLLAYIMCVCLCLFVCKNIQLGTVIQTSVIILRVGLQLRRA